jgi:hypothetical protein
MSPTSLSTMMEDQDLDTIREFIKHRRKYASHFEWFRTEKHLKEVGVVRCLIESISKGSFCEYRNLRPCEIDPPDCLANNVDGALVGFEVRELVDQKAIELNEKGEEVYRHWTDVEIIDEVAAILREKDYKNYAKKPLTKLILVIPTAEPDLDHKHLMTVLDSRFFDHTEQFNEAYLLFQYDSAVQGYPYIELKIGPRRR